MPLAIGIGVGLSKLPNPPAAVDPYPDSSSDDLAGPPLELITADGVYLMTADGYYLGVPAHG